MHVIEVDTRDRRQVRRFLELPFSIYSDTPQWVPLLSYDARRMLDHKRNPFYQHSDAAFFLAMDHHSNPVGRIAILENRNYIQYNQEKTAFFYLFECVQDTQASAALFEAGIRWARSRALDNIIGPKGFTALDGMGLLVEGFEHRPALGLPYNKAYYSQLVETAGFSPTGELVSGYLNASVELPDKIYQLAERLKQRRGLHVPKFQAQRDLKVLVPHLQELYNRSLGGTHGNVPLTAEEASAMASQILWFADPRLIKLVYKEDRIVGFLFAYPDISAALQRTRGKLLPFGWIDILLETRRTKWININGAGMLEGYRGLGGTALLFAELAQSIQDTHYQHADIVQVGVENDRMQRELQGIGIQFHKRHRLYQLRI